MTTRTTLTRADQKSRAGTARATVREIDDKHLMQEIKKADVYHSETPSNFERFQMVGITAVPLPQEEEQNQGQKNSKKSEGGADWNHDQPKGKAAEAVMLYLNGQRSHPIALVDDRRVRPYAMKPGESAFYSASGTGQMVFHNDAGSYVVATNNPQEQSKDTNEKERFASLRHVKVKKQPREIKKGEEVKDHKHEGDEVNMEVRVTSSRIEFRVGDTVVGYYDKTSEKWYFKGKIVEHEAETISEIVTTRFETIGTTQLGLDNKGEVGQKVETLGGPAKKTFAKPD